MAVIRYVRTPEQIAEAAAQRDAPMKSRVRSVRVVYETDPEIARVLAPKPLEPAERPEICVTFSHVAMQITPDFEFEIGSAIFGNRVVHEGVEGIHLLTMAMTAEGAVVGGRETFGEPKKIADITLEEQDGVVSASVSRMGFTYLSVRGDLGDSLAARKFTEHGFCYKAFPSCDPGKAFDTDPLLIRLDWHHDHDVVRTMDGELTLGDSMVDPVADIPIRKLVSMEYEEGSATSSGTVLRSVPGDWIRPFLHGRYDGMSMDGIEVETR